MAQSRQDPHVVLELVSVPHEAPPPYEDTSPPSTPRPTYFPGERGCQDCRHEASSPPPYRALPRRAPQRPVNSVERLYRKMSSYNAVKWGMAMLCLGASAAVMKRFPASSLRPFLIYLVSISALHFFCLALSVRPFSPTTPRPPLWHFFALAVSTGMWGAGAVALLVVYSRDTEAAIPRGDGSEEKKKTTDRWENVVIIAAVSGLFALGSCLCQWVYTVRLCRGFFQADIREGYKRMWERKERTRERQDLRGGILLRFKRWGQRWGA